jgi:hypothetical protein
VAGEGRRTTCSTLPGCRAVATPMTTQWMDVNVFPSLNLTPKTRAVSKFFTLFHITLDSTVTSWSLSSPIKHLFRTTLPLCRTINRVSSDIVITSMVLRVSLLVCLRRTNTSVRVLASLVQIACSWVNAATLGFGNGAVVAGAGAVFDRGAGEFGGYGFVDAGCVGAWVMSIYGCFEGDGKWERKCNST